MTAASAIFAGSRARAADVRNIAPNAAYKSASQSSGANNSTLFNDSSLFVALPANTAWKFDCELYYTGPGSTGTPASGGMMFTFTVPSGSSIAWNAVCWAVPGSFTATNPSPNFQAFTSSGATRTLITTGSNALSAQISGSVLVGGTPGNLQLQWAQGTANATPTVMGAGSVLAAWQIS